MESRSSATLPKPAPPCWLCGHSDLIRLDALSPAEIVKTWECVGVRLSESGRECFAGPDAPKEVVHLRCAGCGFQFFDPPLPGDSAFYKELQAQYPEYYPKTCPAFDRALDFAQRKKCTSVWDVGCGAGYFLDAARAAGLKTGGLDLNAQAVADCRERGHNVYLSTMADFSARRPTERFPLVTSFEVVEHVPDPVEFVREAAALVQPGGWLGISVPDNHGVHTLCELEPHQWPPHHLSRWRLEDLAVLGKRAGLQVVESGSDVRHGWHIRYFMKLQGQIEHALRRRPSLPSPIWPEIACFAYRASLMKRWGPKKGLGIHAFFQKPA